VTLVPISSPTRFAGALLVSAVAGVALGAVDLAGQRVLAYPWADLANSSAVWALAAFVLGYAVGTPPARAAVCGALFLVVAVESYYLATVLTLDDSAANLTSRATAIWIVLGVVAGAAYAATGAALRGGGIVMRLVGAALVGSVFAAEAIILRGGWSAVLDLAVGAAAAGAVFWTG
jgi:hypothetical protein